VIRSISALTGAVQTLSDDGSEVEASPDGKQIVYVDGQNREIRIAGSQGESPRTLFRAPDGEIVASVHWLPGGRRIGYLRGVNGAETAKVETLDAGGGDVRTLMETTAWSIAFAADGRLFYTTVESGPQQSSSLWTATLDPRTGAPSGPPVRIATWAGVTSALPLTISADGRRLGLTKLAAQSDVYLVGAGAGGAAAAAPRPLTTDTRADWPSAWTRDGSGFLFYSNRFGAFRGFRQPIAEESPEPILAGPGQVRSPQFTADGKWIVYVDMTTGPDAASIMRAPVSGGPARQVMGISSRVATSTLQFWAVSPGTAGAGARSFPDVRCPQAGDGSCVVAEARFDERERRSHVVVSSFDPASGRAREIGTVGGREAELSFWDVSPDGSTIASGQFDWGGGDTITFTRVGSGEKRTVQVNGFKNLSDIAWAPDGRGLFAVTGTVHGGQLLRIGLDGKAQLLHTFESQTLGNPRPSPDGRSVLLGVIRADSNAWVIER
jgi:Tol biopolymer transport system component